MKNARTSPRPVAAMPPPTLAEMLRCGDLMAADCPSRHVLRHLTSRWGLLALIALREGTHRFGDLRRKIAGISERMLSQTLQALEADGMVTRTEMRVVPPHVEYDLTELGREAAEKMQALADWLQGAMPRIARHWAETRGDGAVLSERTAEAAEA